MQSIGFRCAKSIIGLINLVYLKNIDLLCSDFLNDFNEFRLW